MTYSEIIAKLKFDSSLESPSSLVIAQWTNWLNEAVADIWATPEWLIWPWVVATQTVTLADYKVALSALDESEAWTVWSADPRAKFSANESLRSYALPCLRDGDDLRVQSANATSEVVIFYRGEVPVYAVDGANTAVIPDALVPWVLAEIKVKYREAAPAPHAEFLLPKAYARRDAEMNKLLFLADQTLRSAPWLALDGFRQLLQPCL